MPLTVLLVAVSGVIFVVAALVLAIVFPRPTPFQLFVFRTTLALAAAGAAAAIPGFLSVDANFTGFAIRASGALAVFLVVYRLNPAALVAHPKPDVSSERLLKSLDVFYRAMDEVSEKVRRENKSEERESLANYIMGIGRSVNKLADIAQNTYNLSGESRDKMKSDYLFWTSCGEINEYYNQFMQDWSDKVSPNRLERIKSLLWQTMTIPGFLTSMAESIHSAKQIETLRKIAGSFNAMGQATLAS